MKASAMPRPSLAATTGNAGAPVHFAIAAKDLHAHLFEVTLVIDQPATQQEVSLPVWIPGSYMIREFSQNLHNLQARQGRRTLHIEQVNKHTWRIDNRADQALTLTYLVYAHDTSVRTAWLDAQRGFFNGTSLCLRVHGQEHQPHHLTVQRPAACPEWAMATGLVAESIDAQGFGTYIASDYDELVDSPVEMGAFWSGHFSACGVRHRFIVAGAAPSFDGKRLLADSQKICEAAIRMWHPSGKPPFKSYLFMLNAVSDGYGGLEHRNSTALICGRRDLPRLGEVTASEGYTTLLGLISHEYFHTWNVKRLRPAEFERYDYDTENYTRLLWFFEGFTSYYDDLLLRRCGLLDDATYLKLLTKTIHQVQQTPGRRVQSVAQASFDAWVKYYRQDANTPNATVSYYTKGALVALCLDLTLRREGQATLDDVLRALWQRSRGGPMSEQDLLDALQEISGRSFHAEIEAWVHGTDDLPLADLLSAHGVLLKSDRPQTAQQMGLRVSEAQGIQIKTVLRGGWAEKAGFAPGDEWLGLEVAGQGWRIHRLEDVSFFAGEAPNAIALVARDGQLRRLPLALPASATPQPSSRQRAARKAARPKGPISPDAISLSVQDETALHRWIA